MSHEVETMFYSGDTPWHGLGKYVGEEPVTSKEAIIAAGLDWEVEKRIIKTEDGEGNDLEIETHNSIVRTTDDRVLGVVGNVYEPYQNIDAFKFMDGLVDEGLMRYHTAGSLRDGKRIWLLGQIGQTDILPQDRVDQFLFLYNSHDGSSLLRCMFTTTRVVCANTARVALREGRGEGIAIKHTRNMHARLKEAQKVLGIATEEFEAYTEYAEALTKLKMGSKRWDEFTEVLIPDNPEAKSNARAENARTNLTELFESGRGSDIPGVRGTGWGAHCAVVEFVNYFRASRGGEEQQARRFESSIFGSGAQFVQKSNNALQGYLKAA